MVSERYMFLDVLRVTGISFVVLAHMSNYLLGDIGPSFMYHPCFSSIGLFALFFTSGYAIDLNNYALNSKSDIIKFFKKRMYRIFPLYWIALSLYILIIHHLSIWWINHFYMFTALLTDGDFTLINCIIHYLGLQIVLGSYSIPLLTLWYIGAILLMYALYPIIVRDNTLTRVIFRSILIWIFIVTIHYAIGLINKSFILWYVVFCLGIICRRIGMNLHLQLNNMHVNKCIVSMAYMSYAIYLFHRQIFQIIKMGLGIFDLPPVYHNMLFLATGLPILLLVSYFSTKMDNNFIQPYLKKYSLKKDVPVIGCQH